MKKLSLLVLFLVSFETFAFSIQTKDALDSDSVEAISKIQINNLEILEKDEMGLNSLAYALQFKKNKVAEYLLDRKIGINVRDYFGRSPLMIGASNNLPVEFLKKI